MPIIGYKMQFNKIKSIKDDTFIINFKLTYTEKGLLKLEDDAIFDIGDYRILLENVFNNFDLEKLKEYDNGIYILSICKYIVDNIPNLHSIRYETKTMIDTYYKEEIIENYNKISGE